MPLRAETRTYVGRAEAFLPSVATNAGYRDNAIAATDRTARLPKTVVLRADSIDEILRWSCRSDSHCLGNATNQTAGTPLLLLGANLPNKQARVGLVSVILAYSHTHSSSLTHTPHHTPRTPPSPLDLTVSSSTHLNDVCQTSRGIGYGSDATSPDSDLVVRLIIPPTPPAS